MEHAEAHERLSDLALEPERLGRLEAGAWPETAELRAHLAACDRCAADLAGWRRTWSEVGLVSGVRGPGAPSAGDAPPERAGPGIAGLGDEALIRPPSALRGRILAAIRAEARVGDRLAVPVGDADRAGGSDGLGGDREAPNFGPGEPPPASGAVSAAKGRLVAARPWLLAAAALVAAVVTGTAGWLQTQELDRLQAEHVELAGAAATLDRVLTTEPARTITLRAADGAPGGTLAWSTREVVVIASGLPAPGPGQRYRCWLEREGNRTPMGWMTFSRSIGYWAGPLSEYGPELRSGGRFGVSLVPEGGSGTPVLVGEL